MTFVSASPSNHTAPQAPQVSRGSSLLGVSCIEFWQKGHALMGMPYRRSPPGAKAAMSGRCVPLVYRPVSLRAEPLAALPFGAAVPMRWLARVAEFIGHRQ
ncbi:hypothetical protein MVI01_07080 [Myxococcus virescens]|uniref:Uncharacterized protein n=1 Tax=Myxococcus virescens TaxID=83456 RepID=A0A511H677_9BACT|nr:hypothetical protein MVI01_07080 [Myxococcus virescens]